VQMATVGSPPLIISGRIAVFSPVDRSFRFRRQLSFP